MRIVRLTKEDRRRIIIDAIRELINSGLNTYDITHDNVAAACSVETSRHTVKHYFNTKQKLYIAASDIISSSD